MGIAVPEDFCAVPEAYKQIMERTPELPVLFQQLAQPKAENRRAVKILVERFAAPSSGP